MRTITWTWHDAEGRKIDSPAGYTVHNYFADDLSHLVNLPAADCDACLAFAYRGPDVDGIGLRWVVT